MKKRFAQLKTNKTYAEKKRGQFILRQKGTDFNSEKIRVDEALMLLKLARSRSHGADLVRRKLVKFSSRNVLRPSKTILKTEIDLLNLVEGANNQLVSRAGEKLAGAAASFKLNFKDKTVLDVGSSTGGFTQYALNNGVKHVIAVEVGTNQMASEIRADGRVELHEKTDIRDFKTNQKIDIVVIDVSFISLTKIMPSVLNLSSGYTQIIAMAKPQFEGQPSDLNSGVVKNSAIRRQILKNLENWFVNNGCVIKLKKDSSLAGKKGNEERFYWVNKAKE
jgi:23S rRNA (cytidine1920-2'-O)/16S rRNA (cytidine1409-2'-O)-methyltransferase